MGADHNVDSAVSDARPHRPAFDTAVAHATLLRASTGELSETFRLHVPGRIVAFGKQDMVAPGYLAAVAAARAAGYEAVERLAGGRAAVFHEGTLAFSWTIPDPDPRRGITARFTELAGLMVRAIAGLGGDARVGELAGEYCPGSYSVNLGGEIKVMGVGQRLTRQAAHVGGVVVVAGGAAVREVLVPVYAALDLPWDPATAGALEDELAGCDMTTATAAIIAELAEIGLLTERPTEQATLAMAEDLEADHLAPGLAGDAGDR